MPVEYALHIVEEREEDGYEAEVIKAGRWDGWEGRRAASHRVVCRAWPDATSVVKQAWRACLHTRPLATHHLLLPHPSACTHPPRCSPAMDRLGLYTGDQEHKHGGVHLGFDTITILRKAGRV